MSHNPEVGPALVGFHLMKKGARAFVRQQWKTFCGRMVLVKDFVNEFGIL